MHSYIISGGSHIVRQEKTLSLINEFGANQFDIIKLGVEELSSIGVAEVREFENLLSLAPAYGKIRLGIINFAETLTIEAQQALLKTLEEPPPHAKIILETQIIDALLPTIISRCQIISVSTKESLDDEAITLCLKTLKETQEAPIGKRLQIIETFAKTREEAANWITLAILSTREAMLDESGLSKIRTNIPPISNLSLLRRLLLAQQQLTANVNPKLVLDNIFI